MLRSGREVAVKVQRPQVREQVLQDLDALDEIAGCSSGSAARLAASTSRACSRSSAARMLRELDYQQEARNLVALAHQLRDFERIIVPLPVDDYTTSRVLTMDYIAGTKSPRSARWSGRRSTAAALASDLFRAYLHQILVDGLFHADPHPGNVLLTPDRRLALIDLGMVGRLSASVQEQLFRLMLAIADGRGDEAAAVVISLGERLEGFDDAPMRRMVGELVGQLSGRAAKELNIGRAMLDMARSASRVRAAHALGAAAAWQDAPQPARDRPRARLAASTSTARCGRTPRA